MRLPPPTGAGIELERVGLKIRGMDPANRRQHLLRAKKPGETLGNHGAVGPLGKSSLGPRLIIGTRPPSAGHIRPGWGRYLPSSTERHLAPFVGYIPQDVELFSGTVAENHRPEWASSMTIAVVNRCTSCGCPRDDPATCREDMRLRSAKVGSHLSGGPAPAHRPSPARCVSAILASWCWTNPIASLDLVGAAGHS